MTIATDPYQLAGLQRQLVNTLEQLDAALDRGDRRAFRIWCGKYRHVTARLATVLAQLVRAD